MFMRATFAIAAAALMSTAGVSAKEKTSADGKEQAAPAKEKKVCRSIRVTGSRMPVRECKTTKEWASDTFNNDGSELGVISKGSFLEGQDASQSLGGPN